MGISSLPTSNEGLYVFIAINTITSMFDALKEFFEEYMINLMLPFNKLFGLKLGPQCRPLYVIPNPNRRVRGGGGGGDGVPQYVPSQIPLYDHYMDKLLDHVPVTEFSLIRNATNCEQECTVCLNHFDLDNKVNQLRCGHIFHHYCFEQWLDYWNINCPLCRTCILSEDEAYMMSIDTDYMEAVHETYALN